MAIVLDPTNGITNVNGTAAAPAITGLDTDTGLYFTTNALGLSTAGTAALYINASQNVGIGVTSTSSRLEVLGSVVNTISAAGTEDAATLAITNSDVSGIGRIAKTLYEIGNLPIASVAGIYTNFNATNDIGGALAFSTQTNAAGGVVERMRIDSSGNVCVGTTSASVYGTNTIAMVGADGAAFKVTGGTGNDAVYAWNNATTGNNGFVRFLTEGTATFRGEITYNRGSAVVAYGTSSDVRLKENIVDSSSSLNKINSIKIRSFDWKETGIHTDYGVIAQELFEVAPEAVIEGDNDDVIKKTWQVDTSVLVPAMIKAIQEQQTIINDLKARIETLEGK